MYVRHASEIWRDFPELVPGVLSAGGIATEVRGEAVDAVVAEHERAALARLAVSPEGELAEVRAWRRAFARMGLKPTQYRCAAESLLRRLRKEGALPRIHPLIDVCNALSVAYAIPVAVFDVSAVADGLEVRYASGQETYLTFSGETEHPAPGEVVFADGAGRAHARRWTNRQSGLSAVRDATSEVLVVAEALHESAPADVGKLLAALAGVLGDLWGGRPAHTVLTASAPRFDR
ncbi:B3/4 domain-containing protein [Nonomuraea sp. NPDC047897]|uniref:B3/B4 domain-containing protein n=1 Tax=Nonomuraea sp. NPDC047897 TaxID=3364346 RepID=UPI00371EA80C